MRTSPLRHETSQRSNEIDAGRIVAGYVELIQRRIADGFTPYFVTFMFHPLPGGPAAIVAQMRREVERVYSTLVTRVVRDPRSPAAVGRLPLLIGCVDLPVRKTTKVQLRDVAVNGGLHVHAVLLIPARSRLRVPVVEHFARGPYLVPGRPLARLDVRPIGFAPEVATDYMMKSLRSGRLSYDDAVLVLPRCVDELPDR